MNDWPVRAPRSVWPLLTFPSGARVRAELPVDVERGLGGRAPLRDDEGMLFDGHQVFWMKDVSFPLDFVCMSASWVIVGVVHGAPESLELLQMPPSTRYVLEVAYGWAARHGVAVGQRVDVGRG